MLQMCCGRLQTQATLLHMLAKRGAAGNQQLLGALVNNIEVGAPALSLATLNNYIWSLSKPWAPPMHFLQGQLSQNPIKLPKYAQTLAQSRGTESRLGLVILDNFMWSLRSHTSLQKP